MNLQLEWIDSPRSEWIEDIESMAEGYPFEKRKTDVLDEDRARRCRSTWERNGSPGEFLAGFFEKKLVGWIRLRPNAFLTDRIGPDYLVADWELIQRNRDDVRERMLNAIRERYPDAIVQFSQPSQNRTARSYYLKQPDVEGGPTDLHFGRPLTDEPPRTDEPADGNIQNLSADDDLETYLPEASSYFTCRNQIEPDSGRKWLAEKLSETLRRDTTEGFAVEDDNGSTGIVVLDRNPPDLEGISPTGRIPFVHTSVKEELAERLLNRARRSFDEADVEYDEVRLDEPSEIEHEVLKNCGYQLLSKRMYFLRFPDGVEPPLG